jgi:holliday junction DNA helicase RuvA
MTNHDIASRLRDHAKALAQSGDNLYRVRAFRQAAFNVLAAAREAEDVFAELGAKGLQQELHIGTSVARTIREYLTSQTVELASHGDNRMATTSPRSLTTTDA